MLTVALVVLLAQVEDPSPPPLLPADPIPDHRPLPMPDGPPMPPEPGGVGPATLEERSEATEGEGFSINRVAAVGGVAAGTGALLVGGALAYFVASSRGSSSAPGVLLLLSLPASLFLGTGVAFGVHRAMGGRGGYGAHLGGGAIGGAVGLVLAAALLSLERGSFNPAVSIGGVFAMSMLFGAGTSLMGELSNFRALRESRVSVAVAPVQGGALALAGFRF